MNCIDALTLPKHNTTSRMTINGYNVVLTRNYYPKSKEQMLTAVLYGKEYVGSKSIITPSGREGSAETLQKLKTYLCGVLG